MRRIVCSVLTGCISTGAGLVLAQSTVHTTSDFREIVGSALLYPGYVVALLLSLGRFHDVSLPVIAAANVMVYSAASYILLVLLAKRKAPDEG